MPRQEYKCDVCGEIFDSINPRARYCSDKCRDKRAAVMNTILRTLGKKSFKNLTKIKNALTRKPLFKINTEAVEEVAKQTLDSVVDLEFYQGERLVGEINKASVHFPEGDMQFLKLPIYETFFPVDPSKPCHLLVMDQKGNVLASYDKVKVREENGKVHITE